MGRWGRVERVIAGVFGGTGEAQRGDSVEVIGRTAADVVYRDPPTRAPRVTTRRTRSSTSCSATVARASPRRRPSTSCSSPQTASRWSRSRSPLVATRKAAQVGVSELLTNLALWAAATGFAGRGHILFSQPTPALMDAFTRTRIDRADPGQPAAPAVSATRTAAPQGRRQPAREADPRRQPRAPRLQEPLPDHELRG